MSIRIALITRSAADLAAQNPFMCICMIPPTDVMHQQVYLIDCTPENQRANFHISELYSIVVRLH